MCTPMIPWAYYEFAQAPTQNATTPGHVPFHELDAAGNTWANDFFLPEVALSGQSPTGTGKTDTITLPNNCAGNKPVIYGQTEPGNSTYFVVQHLAYFHPAKTGTYTFTTPQVDDALYLWLGPNAVSGYTAANANNIWQSEGPYTADYTYTATAGDYIPMRLLFVQAQDCGFFNFYARDPDQGTVVAGQQNIQNNQLLWDCTGSNVAPPFNF